MLILTIGVDSFHLTTTSACSWRESNHYIGSVELNICSQICWLVLSTVMDLCLSNGMNPSCLIHTVYLLDFLCLAQHPVCSTLTLDLLTDSLSHFHNNKDIFVNLDIHDHFNIPKLHYLKHYVNFIKLHGTTNNYNTEYTECLHINLTKDAYWSINWQDKLWCGSNIEKNFGIMLIIFSGG